MRRTESGSRPGSVAPERQCWIDADADPALEACRSVYRAAVGVEPGPFEVRHLCGVARCVRPSHLRLDCGDCELNALFVSASAAHAGARLVESVRLGHAEGASSRVLAVQFNLPRVHVVDLVAGRP